MRPYLIVLFIVFSLALSSFLIMKRSQKKELVQMRSPKGYVATPFGYWPEKCVNRNLEKGTQIIEHEDRVDFLNENGLFRSIPHDQDCLQHLELFRNAKRGLRGNLPNQWMDNASWTTSENVQSYTGNYKVPSDPSNRDGQILYYFIGVENFQSTVSVTILQPVLTFSTAEWTFASWNCCPGGQVNEGNVIGGFQGGDTLKGEIYQDKPLGPTGGKWHVISQNPSGEQSTLAVTPINRVFNWADATLEIYDIGSCDQYAKGIIDYTDLKIIGVSGNQLNPVWGGDGSTSECGGITKVISASEVTIEHTQA